MSFLLGMLAKDVNINTNEVIMAKIKMVKLLTMNKMNLVKINMNEIIMVKIKMFKIIMEKPTMAKLTII